MHHLAYPYDYITENQWLGTRRLSGHIPVCIDDFVFPFLSYLWFNSLSRNTFSAMLLSPGELWGPYLHCTYIDCAWSLLEALFVWSGAPWPAKAGHFVIYWLFRNKSRDSNQSGYSTIVGKQYPL